MHSLYNLKFRQCIKIELYFISCWHLKSKKIIYCISHSVNYEDGVYNLSYIISIMANKVLLLFISIE